MTAMTYKERVLRWRIMRHDVLPEEHAAAYRAEGIDPMTLWRLIWSFETEAAATEMLTQLNAEKAAWMTYKLVDGGGPTEIERSVF